MIQVIHAQCYLADTTEVDQLCADYCSCERSAYNIFKHSSDISFNEVRRKSKFKYHRLNSRQVHDAVTSGKAIFDAHPDKTVVFGGKKLFERICTGKATHAEWVAARNTRLFSGGETSRKGNSNTRVIIKDDDFYLRITVGTRKWVTAKLMVPRRWQQCLIKLLDNKPCYYVRLKKSGNNIYDVKIISQIEEVVPTALLANGCFGIDLNPRTVAVAIVSKDGNLLNSCEYDVGKIFDGTTNKSLQEAAILAKHIVEEAKYLGMGIILEDLKFDDFSPSSKKWNRIRRSFAYKTMLEQILSQCRKQGVEYRLVNPAFTSVISRIKYADMFNVSIHVGAAYVIGRRGLGLKEVFSVCGCSRQAVRVRLLGAMQESKDNKVVPQFSNWAGWRVIRDALVLTGRPARLRLLKESRGSPHDKAGSCRKLQEEPCSITGRTREATPLGIRKNPNSNYVNLL